MWEYITGAIATPLETLRQVAQKEFWKEGLLLTAASGLIKGATAVVVARSSPPSLSELSAKEFPFLETMRSLLQSPAYIMANSLISSILFWFVAGVICFGLSRIFKGKGSLKGLLASLGFASAPNLLGYPLAAVFSLFGSPGLLLSSATSFLTSVWVLALEVFSIRESTGIATGAALASAVIASLGFFCFLLVVGLLLSLGILFRASGTVF